MRPAARVVTMLTVAVITGACAPPPAPVPDPSPTPGIEVPAEVQLGRGLPGSVATGAIRVRALRAVRLVAIVTSCECTTWDIVLPRDLAQGAELEIPVAVDLAKVGEGGLPKGGASGPGHVRREIVVRTDGGEVRTVVSVEVSDVARLDPPVLRLGQRPHGKAIRGSVRVLPGPGATQVNVISVETGDTALSAVVARDRGEQRIEVTWIPTEPGVHSSTVLLGLDRPEDPVVTLAVTAETVSPVSLRPDRIESLRAPPVRPVVARIALNRLDGERLDVLGAESDNHRVLVEILPGAGPQREIQVIIPVPPSPAENAGSVTIRTGVPGAERLAVPFRVRAAPPG